MAKVADEIVVGSNGSVYVAPVGSTAPTDSTTALPAAFKELGYTSEDGVTLSRAQDVEDINVWQSFYPARKVVTGMNFDVSFVLRQWNRFTTELALGATVSGSTGAYTITPNDPETLDERAVVVEWADGDDDFRLYVPRATITETVESQVARGQAADLPVTMSVLGNDDDDPWLLFTNATAAFSGT